VLFGSVTKAGRRIDVHKARSRARRRANLDLSSSLPPPPRAPVPTQPEWRGILLRWAPRPSEPGTVTRAPEIDDFAISQERASHDTVVASRQRGTRSLRPSNRSGGQCTPTGMGPALLARSCCSNGWTGYGRSEGRNDGGPGGSRSTNPHHIPLTTGGCCGSISGVKKRQVFPSPESGSPPQPSQKSIASPANAHLGLFLLGPVARSEGGPRGQGWFVALGWTFFHLHDPLPGRPTAARQRHSEAQRVATPTVTPPGTDHPPMRPSSWASMNRPADGEGTMPSPALSLGR